LRRQLPVYSPLEPRAIAGGVIGGLLGPGGEPEQALRGRLRERFSADEVVLTASGTHALQLALSCLEPRAGDVPAVALPAYSCFDLVTAAVGAGVRVRFYDVDLVSLGPDLDSLRGAARAGVSGVVAGNLHGFPLDRPAIRAICVDAGVPLIEDAAQGVGSGPADAPGGTVGDATVLSFGRGKGWTGGGGGALLLRRAAVGWRDRFSIGEPAAGARAALVTAAAWMLGRPGLYGVPSSVPALGLGETRYKEPTRPSAISSFSAALALRTEAASMAAISERRAVAERWAEELERASIDAFVPCRAAAGPSACSFLRLPLVARDARLADELARRAGRFGVARSYPTALHHLPQARPLIEREAPHLPGSEHLAAALVTLPTHGWVRESDVRGVLDALRGLTAAAGRAGPLPDPTSPWHTSS
jgi:dTDP-4-amino-4,6-dideoxygalactose transaminase